MKVVIGRDQIIKACNEYIKKHYNLKPVDGKPTIKAYSGFVIKFWRTLLSYVFFKIEVEQPGKDK